MEEMRERGGRRGGMWERREEPEGNSVNVRGTPRRERHSSRRPRAGAGVPSKLREVLAGAQVGRADPDGRDMQAGGWEGEGRMEEGKGRKAVTY